MASRTRLLALAGLLALVPVALYTVTIERVALIALASVLIIVGSLAWMYGPAESAQSGPSSEGSGA